MDQALMWSLIAVVLIEQTDQVRSYKRKCAQISSAYQQVRSGKKEEDEVSFLTFTAIEQLTLILRIALWTFTLMLLIAHF